MAEQHEGNSDLYLEEILASGGPESYNKWATKYDDINKVLNWTAPASIVKVWFRFHSEESLRSQLQQLGRKHRVYDAGCGTGLVGKSLATFVTVSPELYDLYGGDTSPGMLEEAKLKKCYVHLKVDNLKIQLPYDEEFFDSIISAGVFLQAHCGPECLPNIFRVLKKGGYFVTTSRKPFYEETKEDWDKHIKNYNCELVEVTEVPYHDEAAAIVLVIRKIE